DIIRQCLENNIWMINVGTKYETSKKAVEIAQNYEKGIYASIGLHPIHLETNLVKIKIDLEEIQQFQLREQEFDYSKYKELARSEKVVAIGEIGLDYYYRPKTKIRLKLFKEKQKTALLKQLVLAKELDLPVIFHCRVAHQDLIKTIKEHNNSVKKGVIHCFTGNWQEAQEYMEMGFYLGFNGLIFKLDFDEIIKKTPLEKILIETDCPYLTPPNFEKERNNPLAVKHVIKKISEIKNLDFKKVVEITTENAKKLFKI
ncbi:TatD family hydrolase, partial [Patescibacteria group bacterium]